MKFRSLISVIFCAIIIFSACNPKSKRKASLDSMSNIIPNSCILHDNRSGRIVQGMDPTCARALIDNYAFQANQLIEDNPNFHNIDSLLIYGARIDLDEMREIINIIDSVAVTKPDSMYIMLAAHNSGRSGIILAFEHGNSINPDPYTYFNFTYPCPDMCPWEMQALSK